MLHEVEGGPASLLAVLEQGEGRILELDSAGAIHRPRALKDLAPPRDSIVGAILRDAAGHRATGRGPPRRPGTD